MADLSGVTDKYFTIASETFTDNLSSSIAALAATVPVLNNSEYTNGDDVVLTVDPGTVNEATFIGRKSGLNFINCVWTEGNLAVGHSNGATIIDYDSATHHNAQTKGIQQFANSNGTLKTQPVRDALGLGATAANGWEVAPYTFAVSSGYNKGNKEFDIIVANNDLTGVYSPGQRLRFTRGTTAPTQCADFEVSSSQYASRATGSVTGTISTMTDDFTAEAWINIESFAAAAQTIVARRSATQGFGLGLDTSGMVQIYGATGGAFDVAKAIVSPPIATWTHVAGSLDMSGVSGIIYINGISVPIVYTNSASTAFVNTGDLEIGGYAGATEMFDGKIADVRVWNIVRTQTQIRDNMCQQLTGSETNLVGYWKLDGNFNDSTSALNHLTASGGVVATNVDNPMQTTEYAIITKVAYSAPNTTITVYTGNRNSIPNMTLTAPYYSAQKTPFLFPSEETNWEIRLRFPNIASVSSAAYNNLESRQLSIPTGKWRVGYDVSLVANSGGASGDSYSQSTFSTSTTVEDDPILNGYAQWYTTGLSGGTVHRDAPRSFTSQTLMYLLVKSPSIQVIIGRGGGDILFARCAYV